MSMSRSQSFDFGYGEYSPTTQEQQEAYQGQSVDLTNNITKDLNATHTVTSGVNGTSTTNTLGTFSTSDFARSENPNDFLQTARNQYGNPARGNLTPDSVVTYQGMEVQLSTLETMGIVQRHPATGAYINPLMTNESPTHHQQLSSNHDQQQQQQEQPQVNKLEAGVEMFDPKNEEAYQAVKANISTHHHDATVARVIANGIDSINLAALARDTGLTYEEANNTVKGVHALFTQQADNVASQMGVINPQHAWDWLQTNHPKQIQAAQQALVFARSTSELRDCIKLYSNKVTPDNDSLKNAGYMTAKGANGETLIHINGYWTTKAAATRAGLL